MAAIAICDRCGSALPYGERCSLQVHEPALATITPDTYWDLCRRCVGELREWVRPS